MNLEKALEWRYATKKFDNTKKVEEAHIDYLKRSVQLAASSYGLQPYKVLVIENPALREQLQPVCWGQSQITDASHLFIIASKTKMEPEFIDAHIKLTAEVRALEESALEGYGDFMKGKVAEMEPDRVKNWNAKQSYIALGNLLAACAELQIDACPMEGFEVEAVDKMLGLPEKGLSANVLVTVGYRSEEDATAQAPKVRKSIDELFETL